MHERLQLQTDKVDGFSTQLRNAEEFNKAFKQIMEALKTQSEQQVIQSETFASKITRDLEKTKSEIFDQISVFSHQLKAYDSRLESTAGHYLEHKDHFDRVENSMIECTKLIEVTKHHFDFEVLQQMKDWKSGLQKKLWLFTDGIFKEFQYVNERLEAKLLHEIGYHDELQQPEPYRRMRHDDVVSQGSIPSISTLRSDVYKRPNSVAKYTKPRDQRAMSELNFNMNDIMEKSVNNMRATILSDQDDKEIDPYLAEQKKFKELATMQDEIRKVRMG